MGGVREVSSIIEKFRKDNISKLPITTKIADELSDKVLMIALINGCNVKVKNIVDYAIPVIELFVDDYSVLDLNFQKNKTIVASISKGLNVGSLNRLNTIFPAYFHGDSYVIKNDGELSNFINLFVEMFDIELIEKD